MSRRRFLQLAGAAAGGGAAVVALELVRQAVASGSAPPASTASTTGPAALPIVAATPSPRRRYRSRPDLAPPLVDVTTREAALAPGLIFLTPANGAGGDGPVIMDDGGELVWMRPDTTGNATDLCVATYRGNPVLTWWEGTNNAGIGSGEHVVVDASYRELARIRGANGRAADLHELQLTARDTALFLADAGVSPGSPATASPGPAATSQAGGQVMDCAIQEVDLATGRLVFEWHAVDHIGIDESVATRPTGANQVYDYVHANSIDEDADGNLILSARNTSAIYKIDRRSGAILWRLGGRRSDFAMGPGTSFALQHDARRQADGTLTIFDDGQAPGHSRAIVLRLDETAMTASLAREYVQPQGLLATSQGNMQVLPDGHVFVGWGSLPRFTEFDADGTLLLDATFTSTQSYRDYRFPWRGLPADTPALAIDGRDGALTVYASWNGATEVATWDVLVGTDAAILAVAASAPRRGFETAIEVTTTAQYVAVRARDSGDAILGTSSAAAVTG